MAKKLLQTVVEDVQFNLDCAIMDWRKVVDRLKFQLPVVNDEGIPTNVHLLETLREAAFAYGRIAQIVQLRELLTKEPISGRRRKGIKKKS